MTRQQRYPARSQRVLEAQAQVRAVQVRVQREISLMAFEMREWGWADAETSQVAPVQVLGRPMSMTA